MIDVSRVRGTETTENTTRTTAVAELAAAEVEGYLGDSLTDADAQALNYGTQLAALHYTTTWGLALAEGGQAAIDRVHARLSDLAERRNGSFEMDVTDYDHSALDKRYPQSTWTED